MTDATAIARIAMLSDLERLSAYSQNLANSGTHGYRRQLPVSLSLLDRSFEAQSLLYGESGTTLSVVDQSIGAMQQTGRNLDVALEGPGYLSVNTVHGTRYTRRGDLSIDAQGRLVIGTGDPVLGTGGDIHLRSEQLSLSPDGEIKVDDAVVARLQLVEFSDPTKLVYEGGGLFAATQGVQDAPATGTKVRHGVLEASNVRPMQDMLGLLETSRHLAMNKNVLTAYDSMLDSAINTLAAL